MSTKTILVALVGMPAAGKSTVSRILSEEFGFHWIKTRDIVKKIAATDAIGALQNHGIVLSSAEGSIAFCTELSTQIQSGKVNVIDSIRPMEHWRYIKSLVNKDAFLVAVSAPIALRKSRILTRDGLDDLLSRDEHPVEKDVPTLISQASHVLVNDDYCRLQIDFLVCRLFRNLIPSPVDLCLSLEDHGIQPSEIRRDALADRTAGRLRDFVSALLEK